MSACKYCCDFFSRFKCNSPDECDCPKCSGMCECGTEIGDNAHVILDWTAFDRIPWDEELEEEVWEPTEKVHYVRGKWERVE